MELKELTEKVLSCFEVASLEQLGPALIEACGDHEKLRQFRQIVDGDMGTDWMQMIYQYYLAERKVKKQDFTPRTISQFMGMLAGNSDRIIDMCAGTGALIIQKWRQNPDTEFVALEIDESVIPFLLFNMVFRNIRCRVLQADVLSGEDIVKAWNIVKGEEFGNIVNFEPTI